MFSHASSRLVGLELFERFAGPERVSREKIFYVRIRDGLLHNYFDKTVMDPRNWDLLYREWRVAEFQQRPHSRPRIYKSRTENRLEPWFRPTTDCRTVEGVVFELRRSISTQPGLKVSNSCGGNPQTSGV